MTTFTRLMKNKKLKKNFDKKYKKFLKKEAREWYIIIGTEGVFVREVLPKPKRKK